MIHMYVQNNIVDTSQKKNDSADMSQKNDSSNNARLKSSEDTINKTEQSAKCAQLVTMLLYKSNEYFKL